MKNNLYQKINYRFIIITSLISLWGAIIYKIYSLNWPGILLSLFLAILSFIIIEILFKNKKEKTEEDYKKEKQTINRKSFLIVFWGLNIFYIALVFACFYILYTSRTADALISPWEVVSKYFFLFYFLATLVLFLNLFYFKTKNLILLNIHFFLSFSVAWIVYQIGYGFDPFIHEATMDLIDKKGKVEPKPFYYLGQYSLIIIFHKITSLPIAWLDKLLVPFLAAASLPFVFWQFLQKWLVDTKINNVVILFLLILPFSFFILSTPQNLAYLFLILTIFLGLTCKNLPELTVVFLLALNALFIHPLAGIPAVIFSLFISIYNSELKRFKKTIYSLLYILLALSLPLSFYIVNNNHGAASEQAVSNNFLPSWWPKFILPNQGDFILNFVYAYKFNLAFLISVLIATGLIIAYKYKKTCRTLWINFFSFLSLLIAYILTTQLPFNFLIYYERKNYTNRIIFTSVLFLLPFILIAFYALIEKLKNKNKFIKIPFFLFLILLVPISLYAAYPRLDRYHNSHGYSVSQTTLEAVSWIENDAQGRNYIVLANQQVSVAALNKFGFDRYYKNDIYFYPIPTGGQLYQYYLDMIYEKPAKKTMAEAMDMAGVKKGYFVLNKYWWAFEKIKNEAKLESDSWNVIGDDDKIYIFEYKK